MERARAQNEQRAEELAYRGRRFRHFPERECCGYLETFRFLKGRSRVIALADYKAEKAFVTTVPHRVLIGMPEEVARAQSFWNLATGYAETAPARAPVLNADAVYGYNTREVTTFRAESKDPIVFSILRESKCAECGTYSFQLW